MYSTTQSCAYDTLAHLQEYTFSHACVRVSETGCCREERFNVFTPPIKKRVGPGMLIARETIVGFYYGMRDSLAMPYRTSRDRLCFILKRVICATWISSSRAFTNRFLSIFRTTKTMTELSNSVGG